MRCCFCSKELITGQYYSLHKFKEYHTISDNHICTYLICSACDIKFHRAILNIGLKIKFEREEQK